MNHLGPEGYDLAIEELHEATDAIDGVFGYLDDTDDAPDPERLHIERRLLDARSIVERQMIHLEHLRRRQSSFPKQAGRRGPAFHDDRTR